MHRYGISVSRVLLAALMCAAIFVCAEGQEGRTSSLEASMSLGFQVYLAPFAKVDTAAACRDICLKDTRCEGWTYYHSDYKDTLAGSEDLPRTCIVGGRINERIPNMPGRTSGQIR